MLPRTLLALALGTTALAQNHDVALLGHLGGYSFYNDVWGYRAPDGREYALVGTRTGTSIVNATNPAAPFEVAFIPGNTSTWRDIRTYDRYAYIVTEAAAGMQVVDMTAPDSPVLLGVHGAGDFGNAHNISVDLGTGWIYVVGTNNGTITYDASTTPATPAFVGATAAPYLHDIAVENGLAHCSALYDGEYEIWDVTSFPFTVLSQTPTPDTFTHNAWPNAATTVCATTDEVTGGVVQFYDTTNRAAPIPLGNYTANPASIPHNAFVLGDVCHISHYTEGYRAVDVSDPSNPVEVGAYDTWPGPTGGFNGAWGCYPFQPSGNIYISDTATGLYILKRNVIDIGHTPLTDTLDESGPYAVTATVTSDSAISSVDLFWSVDGGASNQIAMTPTGNPDEFTAAIPGQLGGTRIEYSIEVVDALGKETLPLNGVFEFAVGSLQSIYFEDFEGGAGGWTHGQTATQDDWQFGAPAGAAGSFGAGTWSDPTVAYSGANCWGNDLGISGFNGSYQANVSNWIQSPSIATGGAQGLRLRFRRWLTVQDRAFDQARVLVNGQVVWQNDAGADTLDTEWHLVDVDVSSITDAASTVDVRFTLDTDGSVQLGGWNFDDVELFVLSDCVPGELYGIATPGTGGLEPTMALVGEPRIGSTTFGATTTNALGGANAFLGIGFVPTQVTAIGITLLVNPIPFTVQTTASGPVGQAGAGTATAFFPIPNNPGLDDINLRLQWFVADPGSPSGLVSASRGARVRICSF